MRDDADRVARAAWDLHLQKARDSLPERFSWVRPLRKHDEIYVLPDMLTSRLPWITPAIVAALRAIVEGPKNVLICGPYGTGKTTLLAIVGRWYLRAAEYDHPKIRAQRERCEAHRHASLPGQSAPPPRSPDSLREVQRARDLRFVAARNLLATNQRNVDDAAVEQARRASVLLLDAVGEEMRGAERGTYLSSARVPAVSGVLEDRWDAEKRFFVTTPYDPSKLEVMYEGGVFRRLVDDASVACVIDLNEDQWAGAFIRERAKNKVRSTKP
jgi:hypothetical protein